MPAHRDNPYPNFNFSVEIDGEAEAWFAELELPDAEIDVIEYREGGDSTNAVRKLPGRVRYGNVVLRRGVSGRLELWEWFEAVASGQLQRRDVTVVLHDERRNAVQRWLLFGAWPVKYETSALNAKGNEIVIETLVLAVESFDLA